MRRLAVSITAFLTLGGVAAFAQVFPEYGAILRGREKPGVFHFPDVPMPQQSPGTPSAAQPIGDIAFVHKGDLYTVTVDGRYFRRLTSDGRNAFPIWSPDGRYIAFSKAFKPDAEGRFRGAVLCIVTSDGKYVRTLKQTGSKAASPACYPVAWLPDGKGLVYAEYALQTDAAPFYGIGYLEAKRNPGILIGKWAGATQKAGFLPSPVFSFGDALAFSSSGTTLVFQGSQRRDAENGFELYDLYQMKMDGSALKRLPPSKARSVQCLRWHPKAGRLLSSEIRHSDSDPPTAGIWLMDSSANYVKKLANSGIASHSGMDWSPEGGYIIYQVSDSQYPTFEHPEAFGTLSTHAALWVMKSDGTGRYKMLDGACHPNWR